MALPEQKKKLLKAKIAVALHDEHCISNGKSRRKTDNWRFFNSIGRWHFL
jgi:hypothetical protein